MRRIALLFLLCVPSGSQVRDEFTQKIIDFEEHWNPFILKYAGCKDMEKGINPENCDFSKSQTSFDDWKKAREAAKKLFKLSENN